MLSDAWRHCTRPGCIDQTVRPYSRRAKTGVAHAPPASSAVEMSRPSSSLPGRQLRIGIISDIQYANIEDGLSFSKVPRYYRGALVSLARAVSGWQQQDVDFVMHFGDIVDGFNPKDQSDAALNSLLAEFERLGKPHWHMLGNHCLYNFPRAVLNQRLRMGTPDSASYYQWSPHPQWRIFVMDAYDVSELGWPEAHPLHQQAVAILDANNPHENKGKPPEVEGPGQRFCRFNGAASSAQLAWLQSTLEEARTHGQRAIVCCHVPLYPGTCNDKVLLWNYEEVLEIIQGAGNVVATFCGHAHNDGYLQDDHGIHHRVLNGVIETPTGQDCYGWLDVFEDQLVLQGVGALDSGAMQIHAAQH